MWALPHTVPYTIPRKCSVLGPLFSSDLDNHTIWLLPSLGWNLPSLCLWSQPFSEQEVFTSNGRFNSLSSVLSTQDPVSTCKSKFSKTLLSFHLDYLYWLQHPPNRPITLNAKPGNLLRQFLLLHPHAPHLRVCVCVCPVWLFATPWTVACQASPVRGICQPRKLEWGCHFLLQGIFLNQGSNPYPLCLLHWQADSSTTSVTWEARVKE